MPELNQDPEKLLALSEEDLLTLIGMEVGGTGLGVRPSIRRIQELGKEWLEERRLQLKELVCGNERIRKLEKDTEPALIVAAIADLISSTMTGVAPMTVAALIVKRGMTKFCAEDWSIK